jgi:hypothetical protein
MTLDTLTISPVSRFRAAMILAIIADALQIGIFPLFVEGALSPADDLLDFGVGAAIVCGQARAGGGPGSFMDDGRGKCLSQIEANQGDHGRKS